MYRSTIIWKTFSNVAIQQRSSNYVHTTSGSAGGFSRIFLKHLSEALQKATSAPSASHLFGHVMRVTHAHQSTLYVKPCCQGFDDHLWNPYGSPASATSPSPTSCPVTATSTVSTPSTATRMSRSPPSPRQTSAPTTAEPRPAHSRTLLPQVAALCSTPPPALLSTQPSLRRPECLPGVPAGLPALV
jgi:hypothetical protein